MKNKISWRKKIISKYLWSLPTWSIYYVTWFTLGATDNLVQVGRKIIYLCPGLIQKIKFAIAINVAINKKRKSKSYYYETKEDTAIDETEEFVK